MTMKIISQLYGQDMEIYYDEVFRNVLEDHIPYLRSDPNTTQQVITKELAWRYRNDFFSLLKDIYNVAPHLRWLIMRMSGYLSPTEPGPELSFILIPNDARIAQIANNHLTTYNLLTQ